MPLNKTWVLMAIVLVLCLSLSGCALLTMPFQLLGGIFGGIFNLLGKALSVADSMPKPPPWVFL